MKTLKNNYAKNIEILRENLKRGMTPSMAIKVIEGWRTQFVNHKLYGEDEVEFINQALTEVENYTHLTVAEIA